MEVHQDCCRRYVYDGELEQQMYMLFDANKKLLATGDIYPSATQLTKGEYTVRLLLRHDSAALLDKFRALPLVRIRSLASTACLTLCTGSPWLNDRQYPRSAS